MRGALPVCGCGGELIKLPSAPALVKVKGEGGFPARRKFVKGTAAYSGSAKEWSPLENNRFIPEKE